MSHDGWHLAGFGEVQRRQKSAKHFSGKQTEERSDSSETLQSKVAGLGSARVSVEKIPSHLTEDFFLVAGAGFEPATSWL